jgi:GT2 family glycosyltransferase
MKLLFAIVNYKTDEPLLRLLDSIRAAAQPVRGALTVQVTVVDNSQREIAAEGAFVAKLREHYDAVEVEFPRANLGYFGALPAIQGRAAAHQADMVVVSNADLLLANDFFSQLLAQLPTDAAVIAPAIISEGGQGFDQNPKHMQRRSSRDLRRLRLIYSTRVTYSTLILLGKLKERLRPRAPRPASSEPVRGGAIYAAHGALFVFTKAQFLQSLPKFEPFLFGEELFVAEEARRQQQVTLYAPALRVYDSRHASTATLGSDRHRRLLRSSIEFILCRYY